MVGKKEQCCKDKNLFKCFLFLFLIFIAVNKFFEVIKVRVVNFINISPVFMTLCAKPELFITYSQSQHIKTDKAIHMTHLRRSSYQWKLTLLKSLFSALLRGIKFASPVWKSWIKAFVSQNWIKLAGNC